MKLEPVAHRYAKALFHLDLSDQELDDILYELKVLGSALHQIPMFKETIISPLVTRNDKKNLLTNIFKGKINNSLLNLLLLLIEKDRLPLIPSIIQAYEDKWMEKRKKLKATVQTPISLDPVNKTALITNLERHFNKTIELNEEIDPGIKGGAILWISHYLLNSSVSSRLEKLKQFLET